MSRNAPPVAGAVAWVRQLLRRVEEPMKVFKQEGSVLQTNVGVHRCSVFMYSCSVVYVHVYMYMHTCIHVHAYMYIHVYIIM